METANKHLSLPDHVISEIRLLSGIAKANGSLISLKDIAALTHANLSKEQLEAAWPTIPGLATVYELENGLILEQEPENTHLAILGREIEKRARAESYASYAREFASLCRGRKTTLIAISGSTSYQTVSETDDLDFFCITKPDFLWIFLTKSLLLSRFFHLSRRDAPRICFSYAVDQSFAEREFTLPNDALFARDALTTMVIRGTGSYKRLLKRSSWISQYFPRLYQQRTNTPDPEDAIEEQSASSPGWKFLNLLLRLLVGSYIGAKSAMLNRKFRKHDRSSSLFTLRIGPDHCIFESVRYSHLRFMYRQLDGRLTESRQLSLSSGTR